VRLTDHRSTLPSFGRDPPYITRPLLHHLDERVYLVFSRRNLTGSEATPRSTKIPPMTEAQAEALDAVHFAAAADSVKIEPVPGDMLFVNNFGLMHSRGPFRSDPEAPKAGRGRYALRLWLHNPAHGWEVPPGLRLAWDRVFGEDEDIANYWDIDPYVERGSSLYFKQRGMNVDCSSGGGAGVDHGQSSSCG
jgi:hypothetical protein